MKSQLDLQLLHDILGQILKPFESAAVCNSEGQLLAIKSKEVSEAGSFTPFLRSVLKYFKPQDGDTYLVNDPYIGGVSLSVFSLLTCFKISDQLFFLIGRTHFLPNLKIAQKLDEEGVRVPPTPVGQNHQLNDAILLAIAGHPLAPQDIEIRLRNLYSLSQNQKTLLERWAKSTPATISKSLQKELILQTKNAVLQKINDTPRGEATLEVPLEKNEFIRARVEIKSQEITIDFTGTTSSQRLFLSDVATYGACLTAVLTFLEESSQLNEGVFSSINVTSPLGCLLNAKYPSPVFAGTIECAPIVANAVFQALSSITGLHSVAPNSTFPTMLSFQFPDGSDFFDSLPGGTGAQKKVSGVDGCQMWSLDRKMISLESIETKYPIRIHQAGVRQSSSGKGKALGGNGLLKEYEVLSKATLRWHVSLSHTNIKIDRQPLKGTAGSPADLYVLTPHGEKMSITQARGEMTLNVGDKVIVASSGGGSF